MDTVIPSLAVLSLSSNGDKEGRRRNTLPPQPKGLLEEISSVSLLVSTMLNAQSSTGDTFSVNPDISSGLPIATLNRNPQPASRPEKYSTPATKGLSTCASRVSLPRPSVQHLILRKTLIGNVMFGVPILSCP